MKKDRKIPSGGVDRAFTLAEVLITLVIIGVVAAITVPMLLNNTQDKEWNVGKQKAKATIGEAFRLMTVNGEITDKLTTTQFAETILPKYLKLAKKCGTGAEAAKNCGFADTIKRSNGTTLTRANMPMTWETSTYAAVTDVMPTASEAGQWKTLANYNTKYPGHNDSYFLQTLDGFSLNFFYNPYCAYDLNDKYRYFDSNGKIQQSMDVVCFNAVYDMNGPKGPNQVGKDIGFVGSFYNNYNTKAEAVLPHIIKDEVQLQSLSGGSDRWLVAMNYCKGLSDDDSYILPDVDELSLLYLNQQLLRGTSTVNRSFFSRSPQVGTQYFRNVYFNGGHRGWLSRTSTREDYYVRCVRNNALK